MRIRAHIYEPGGTGIDTFYVSGEGVNDEKTFAVGCSPFQHSL